MHALLVFLGHPISFFVSLKRKNSILLAILHGMTGWLYLVYVAARVNYYESFKKFKEEESKK